MEEKNLNSLEYWKNGLAGNLAAKPEHPQRGWYRGRYGGSYLPVAFWYVDDVVNCIYNGKDVDKEKAYKLWNFVFDKPITYRVYEDVTSGKPWPDDDPTVAGQRVQSRNVLPGDIFYILTGKINAAENATTKYATISDDEMAAKAQTLRSHCLELNRQADNKREELKKPHWEQVKAVDGKWQPIVKKAKECADKIKKALSDFETEKLRKAPPPPDTEVATTIKGASGRAASVKPRRVAVAITNLDALLFSIKERDDFKVALLEIAQRILDANQDVLGVKIDTIAEVR